MRTTLALSPRHGRARAELYRRGAVLAESVDEEGVWHLSVELSEPDLVGLCRREGLPGSPDDHAGTADLG